MKYAIIGHLESGEFREEVAEDRYEEIKRAKDVCMLALDLEEKINLLIDNHYELEVDLLKLAEAQRIWPQREHTDAMAERLLLDRRVVNLLTSCRLYLDHSGHTVSSLFGKNSPEWKAAVEGTHKMYDGVFGYRLMEALRNHVQHRGLLVHSINYNFSRVTHDDGDRIQHTVGIMLQISYLEQDGKFKASILEEVKGMGKAIDLRPSLRAYVSGIWALHFSLRRVIADSFADRFTLYGSIVAQYRAKEDKEIRYPKAVRLGDRGEYLEEIALVEHLLPYYELLCLKNQRVVDLNGSYASGFCKRTP